MRYIVAFLSIVWVFLAGCTPASNHHNFPNTAKVNHCENTFVLSGYGESIMLFEHEVNSTQFQLLRWYDNGTDAFYDCQSNQIISLLEGGNNSGITEGIRFFDLKDNHRTIVKTHEGFNRVVARYKRGFIYSAAKIKLARVNTQKYGCIPKENIIPKDDVIGHENEWPPEMVSDYKQGKLWYNYVDNYLFDIDSRKKAKNYPYGLMTSDSERIGKDLYVSVSGGFLKIDLDRTYAENFYSADMVSDPSSGKRILPRGSVGMFVKGIYYLIVASNGGDTRRLEDYKKGGLYQIKDKKISYLTKLPFDDIVYANSPDKKYLYIFTKSRKVMKYDIEHNTTVATYTIPVDIDPKYVLGTVGFTKDNFILTFQEPGWAHAYVVVANRDFSKISQPYYIEMAGISVTTQQSVQTNHDRVNDIE